MTVEQRDIILFGDYCKCHYGKGAKSVRYFNNVDKEAIQKLIDGGCLNPFQTVGTSVPIRDILELSGKHNEKFSGYTVHDETNPGLFTIQSVDIIGVEDNEINISKFKAKSISKKNETKGVYTLHISWKDEEIEKEKKEFKLPPRIEWKDLYPEAQKRIKESLKTDNPESVYFLLVEVKKYEKK